MKLRELWDKWTSINLIIRIVAGLLIGIVLALVIPGLDGISLLGTLFVNGLKCIAPFLVFFLIIGSIAGSGSGLGSRFKTVLILYIGSTIVASVLSVVLFYAFPVGVTMPDNIEAVDSNSDISVFLINLLSGMIGNPLTALVEGNYLCILFWSAFVGVVLKATDLKLVKDVAQGIADLITKLVRIIIEFAPIGVLGIVYGIVSDYGMEVFVDYGALIILLVVCMAIVMFITNPLIGGLLMRKNPYPLLYKCLRESGIMAFLTRSSAANIPVNMNLCDKLGLDKEFYSVSIPLGATINMNGAAVTITIMSLCAAYTLGMDIPIAAAMLLCIISTIAACGASGVSGGSLLLIPMACSLLGLPPEAADMMIGIGFVIGVIQDSVETALNSSADVFYTSVSEVVECRKKGEVPHYNF